MNAQCLRINTRALRFTLPLHIAFRTGQRHIITGFGLGIMLTLVREILTYGPDVVRMTGLVYAAGYLFAVATTIALRTLVLKIRPDHQVV
ncbi:MAG: hypothetical protein P8X74_21835 [Reinekea sp.]